MVRTLTTRTSAAADRPIAVLIVDLDRFKEVNDNLGHSAGDDVLRQVTEALCSSVRDGDMVARLGGDEFAALLPETGQTAARQVAQRMVDAVAKLDVHNVTVSVGVASGPAPAVRDTIAHADQAMYEAKRAGGNKVGG